MHLEHSELLSPDLRILALSRENMSTEHFMAGQEQTLKAYLGEQRWSEALWQRFCQRVDYVSVQFTDVTQYAALSQKLSSERVAIFYFATPPSLFQIICENLSGSGCLTEQSRVVLEKPIGRNHANCKEVNETVGHFFEESRIYRIDHYLGKKQYKTFWRYVLPTVSSMPSGTIPASIMCRSPWQRPALTAVFPITIRSGNCEICCKIT